MQKYISQSMAKPISKRKKSLLTFDLSFGHVSLTQKLLFAKNMSLMLQSGLSIVEAIDAAKDSSDENLRKILIQICEEVKTGSTLSHEMALYPRVFSGFFINTVRAGEASGTLAHNLTYAAVQLEKDQELQSKVKGALLYPAIVVSATLILGLVLSFVVLPKITPLFEGMHMELPVTTRILIGFSHLIQNYGVYLLIGIFVFIFSILYLLRQKYSRPFRHFVMLKTPVFQKLAHNAALARFSLTLGTLLKAGVPIDEGLSITAGTVGNYYYEKVFEKIIEEVRGGDTLSECLEEYPDLFPLLITRMVEVGEKSGGLEATFLYLADYYEREVDTSTKSLATAIEPMLLLFIGCAVAFLALSIISPIYNITGSIH